MADIEILVDSSQVKTAKQELQDLGNSFNSAAKSASVYMQAFARAAAQSARDAKYLRDVARANQEIINKNLKVSNSYNSAEASAAAFTVELRKQEAQALKTARANQDAINKQLGVSGPSAVSGGAGYGAIEGEIERLRQKYDLIYASSQLYERSLNELNSAHLLGVLSTKQHEAAVESLNQEYQNFQSGTAGIGNRFARNVQQNMAGLNNAGVLMQQLGYQAGDFIVQVQSGTNAFVAFGQQATQMVGFLPMFAQSMGLATVSVLGFNVAIAPLTLGLSIIIPLLTAAGAMWMRTGDSAKDAAEGVSTYVGVMKALTEEIQKNQEAFLKLKFDTESLGVASASQQLEDLEEKLVSLNASIGRMRSQGGKAAAYSGLSTGSLKELEAEKSALEAQLSVLEAQEEAQRMLNGGLSVAASIQRGLVYDKQVELAAAADLRKEYVAQIEYMGRTRQESDSFVSSLKIAYQVLANSKIAAGGIADQLARAANSWVISNSPGGAAYMANQYTLYGEGRTAFDRGAKESSSLYGGDIPKEKSGGGKTDPMVELRQQIKLENELLGLSEAQARVLQALGQDRGKYSKEEIALITAEIDAYNKKLEAIENSQKIWDTVKSSMEDAVMSMVEGTETVASAFKQMAYEIIKELYNILVVQQMVGSFDTATQTGTGILGALGGLVSGSHATGGSVMPNQTYLVGENGPELVVPRHSGTVVNANQTAAMGGSGSVTVNNNISVTGSDAAMVRTEIAKMIPQITNATKAAVIDAKQRGGQMAAAFR